MPSGRAPSIFVAELKRQIDHQITAPSALDTQATALLAATLALAALAVPRVDLDTGPRMAVAVATVVAVVTTEVRCLQPWHSASSG
jgi:hypothetical protein